MTSAPGLYSYPIDPEVRWVEVTIMGPGEAGNADRPGRAGKVTTQRHTLEALAKAPPLVIQVPRTYEEKDQTQ